MMNIHLFCHKETDSMGVHLTGWSSHYAGIFACPICSGKFFKTECTDAFGGKEVIPIPEAIYNDLRAFYLKFQGYRVDMGRNNEIHIKTRDIFAKYGMGDKYPFSPPTPKFEGEI